MDIVVIVHSTDVSVAFNSDKSAWKVLKMHKVFYSTQVLQFNCAQKWGKETCNS